MSFQPSEKVSIEEHPRPSALSSSWSSSIAFFSRRVGNLCTVVLIPAIFRDAFWRPCCDFESWRQKQSRRRRQAQKSRRRFSSNGRRQGASLPHGCFLQRVDACHGCHRSSMSFQPSEMVSIEEHPCPSALSSSWSSSIAFFSHCQRDLATSAPWSSFLQSFVMRSVTSNHGGRSRAEGPAMRREDVSQAMDVVKEHLFPVAASFNAWTHVTDVTAVQCPFSRLKRASWQPLHHGPHSCNLS
ncbi:unnamed protein product [Symbiodinium sp. CCMP2592]|nr:unnamed protein product [Symbiodinium sp. CCMP2592]